MLNRNCWVAPVAAMLFAASAAPALAGNHTVVLSVPVDISAMPYIESFSVGCRLDYAPGTPINVYNRNDTSLVAGEFHGKVDVSLTAPDGPAPTGYTCTLSVFPIGAGMGFTPLDPKLADSSTPKSQFAAAGTTPVTKISGTFGALSPQRMRTPMSVMH